MVLELKPAYLLTQQVKRIHLSKSVFLTFINLYSHYLSNDGRHVSDFRVPCRLGAGETVSKRAEGGERGSSICFSPTRYVFREQMSLDNMLLSRESLVGLMKN